MFSSFFCVTFVLRERNQAWDAHGGFKRNSGTSHYTLTVKGVAKHYVKRRSRVFAAFLDVRKAFDHSNYYRILSRLLMKGIPVSVVRLLLKWYESTNIRVMWRNNLSDTSFGINHGVRQGGLLSPILFSVGLIDDLLERLEQSGIGCRISFKYFGAIAYADDIVLMAPSVEGLNSLLSICSAWSIENRIDFNPSKSYVICFAENSNKWPPELSIPAYMNGTLIPTRREVVHLGHLLTDNLDESSELIRVAKAFNKQFHAFFCRFNGIDNISLMSCRGTRKSAPPRVSPARVRGRCGHRVVQDKMQ